MEIKVSGRHPGITPHVKDYVGEKTGRLERYFDGTHRIEVIMSKEADVSRVELLISATGRQMVCEGRAADLYAAFDAALDKAEKQLVRYKEKLHERRVKPATEGAVTEAEAAAEEGTVTEEGGAEEE